MSNHRKIRNKEWVMMIMAILLFCILDIKAQKIISEVTLDLDQGALEAKYNHVTRDENGYFYLFGPKYIQRYDGEFFLEVDASELKNANYSLSDLLDVFNLNNGDILLYFGENKATFTISNSNLFITQNKGLSEKKELTKNFIFFEDEAMFHKVGKADTIIKKKGDVSYLWHNEGLTRVVNGIKSKTIPTIHHNLTLHSINQDKLGNMIACYSKSINHVDHIYVLDSLDRLIDYSILAAVYTNYYPDGQAPKMLNDIQSDNVFNKLMLVGNNSIKIFSLLQDGMQNLLNDEHLNKKDYGNIISGISATDDKVYFSTNEGGISYYSGGGDGVKSFIEKSNLDIAYLGQMKLSFDEKKLVLRAINSGKGSKILEIDLETSTIQTHEINGLVIDFLIIQEGKVIIGTSNEPNTSGKLLLYDLKNRRTTTLVSNLPAARSIYYYDALEQYWIGTEQGLFVYDKFWTRLAQFTKQGNSIASTAVKTTIVSHDDITMVVSQGKHLIAGSLGGGVYIIEPASFSIIKQVGEREGLTDNRVVGLVTDDQNNCWVSTFIGLNVLDSKFTVKKRLLGVDGLPSREFNFQSVCKDKNGQLYFGTINGVCKIDPAKVLKWKNSYNVHFNETSVFQNNFSKILQEQKMDDIYQTQDSICFHFNQTDYFKYPHKKPFYNVQVNQKSVNAKLVDDKVTLSNYEPGLLSLTLGSTSEKKLATINLNVKNDYRNISKILLGFLFFLIIMTVLFMVRIKRIKKREKEKTVLNNKMSDLRLTTLQGQMNPHFIFNALGSIQYFIQVNNQEKADEYLTDFAVLIRGILDSSSNKLISLQDEIELLNLYIRLEKMRFEDSFNVIFNIAENVDLSKSIPPMLLQPYIENSINHGLYHLENRKGQLDISFEVLVDSKLEVIIRDNGIGRKGAQEINGQKNHQSKGMNIISERIKTINACTDFKIKEDLIDLIKDGRPCGTEVKIVFSLTSE